MARAGLDTTAVLLKAAELADEAGFDALTLGELAKRLHVRAPSLYNHVDSLPALKQQLAIHAIDRLQERLAAAAEGKTGDEAVRVLGEAYVGFVRQHPGLYAATVRAAGQDEALRAAQRRVLDVVIGVLEPYGLEAEDALHTVRGLRSILHGFASIESMGGFGMPLDLDSSFRRLIDTFLAGLHVLASGQASGNG